MTKQIITAETVRLAWKAGESVIVYAKGFVKLCRSFLYVFL